MFAENLVKPVANHSSRKEVCKAIQMGHYSENNRFGSVGWFRNFLVLNHEFGLPLGFAFAFSAGDINTRNLEIVPSSTGFLQLARV